MPRYIQIETKTLDNGLRICAAPFPEIKTITLHAFIFVGSAYENSENNGVSHFLEHMLFRGNEKLGDASALHLKIEKLGGNLDAATSFDLTEFRLQFHSDYLEKGIECFCQFLRYPLLRRIEVERTIILEEIQSEYNDKNKLINVDSVSARELWPSHPLGLPIGGTLETIRKISESDLAAWFREYYQPGNMIVGVSGDFDESSVIDMIDRQFRNSAFSTARRYPPAISHQVKKQISLTFDTDNQFNLQWNFVNHIQPELYLYYRVIHQILDDGYSSRLQRVIREEKGLVYDISADLTYFNQGALFSINATVSLRRFQELTLQLTGLIQDLIEKGVSEDELRLAKLRGRLSEEQKNDSVEGMLYKEINSLIYPGVYSPKNFYSRLESIDLETINKIVVDLFKQNQSCFVLIGPWTNEHKKFLETQLKSWTVE